MAEFIGIGKENGELSMAGMEKAALRRKIEQARGGRKLIRIHEEMGKEITKNMESILSRPDMQLICASYDKRPGAIMACYVGSQRTHVFGFWCKLREEIKNPLADTALIAAVDAFKASPDEFIKFVNDKYSPIFEIAKNQDWLKLKPRRATQWEQ